MSNQKYFGLFDCVFTKPEAPAVVAVVPVAAAAAVASVVVRSNVYNSF